VRQSPVSIGVLLFAAVLITACAEPGLLAPGDGRTLTASFETGASGEPPDSGAVTIYPYEGPAPIADDVSTEALATPIAGPRIRIGVVQSASAVTLGSTGDYAILDKATNIALMTGNAASEPATVTLLKAPPTFWRLQVMCASTATVAVRKAAAEAAGHVTLTEFVPSANCTRLYIGEFALSVSFAIRNAYRNQLIAAGLAGTDSFYRQVTIGTALYLVTRGSTVLQNVSPVVVTSSTGLVAINGAIYRDMGEARLNSGGMLAGINELPVEQYLYGVVPRELGPIAFPQIEAQKAQAVAARTFAIAGFGRRGSDGYDLRATTDDQVYGGYAAEHPVSSAAVDATAGMVATYDGRPISALYHSTSGGHTADNEEAFTGTPTAYLRGVPDSPGGRTLERLRTLELFRAYPTPVSLREVKDSDSEFAWSRFHRWTFEWTMQEMTAVISAFAGQPVGAVTAINVLERGPSGRVLEIAYVTDAGTFTSRKDQIRASLKFINAAGVPTNLLSTLFFIEPVHAAGTNTLVGYRAYGGGFGHGVGMSQTGAVSMAAGGLTYDLILRYYYRGAALTAWY
jgi:stage II sporulation protein D